MVEITSETTAETIDDMDSGSGEATLYAKNQAGQEVWTHTFTIEAMTELPPVSPAAITADRAYVEVGGTLYALSLADGAVLWALNDVGVPLEAPLVDADGTIYLSGYYGPDLVPFPRTAESFGVSTASIPITIGLPTFALRAIYSKSLMTAWQGKRPITCCLINPATRWRNSFLHSQVCCGILL